MKDFKMAKTTREAYKKGGKSKPAMKKGGSVKGGAGSGVGRLAKAKAAK